MENTFLTRLGLNFYTLRFTHYVLDPVWNALFDVFGGSNFYSLRITFYALISASNRAQISSQSNKPSRVNCK
jgi:hypothetical protein